MSLRFHRAVLLLLVLISFHWAIAQDDQPTPIYMIGKPIGGEIKLRWAPTKAVTWQLANKYGYTLEKYVLFRDGKKLRSPEKALLNDVIFYPAPQSEWEPLIDDNDYIAIAAQGIFGETFELSNEYQSDMAQIVNKSKELDSRFSFTIFAADMSFRAAELSGLAYSDPLVKEGEKYIYRLFPNIPADIEPVDTAFLYLGLDDLQELPVLRPPEVELSELSALLSWKTRPYSFYYSAYDIERSSDGVSYEVVNPAPIADIDSDDNPNTDTRYFMDSLPDFNRKYYYRIIGLSPFGERGQPSASMEVTPRESLAYVPVIQSGLEKDDGSIQIDWVYPQNDQINRTLKGWVVESGNTDKGPYLAVHQALLPASQKSFTDSIPGSASYYRVLAIGNYDQTVASSPFFVQRMDSIPPSPPTGLSGEIDSTGRVKINWAENQEPDLYGYRVFMANYAHEEFVQITEDILPDAQFTDSIGLDNLTEHIFYKVVATDKRYNNSNFSQVLKLVKPDIVPPVAPVVNSALVKDGDIQVKWTSSSSEDLNNELLYRSVFGEENWELVGLFDANDRVKTYTDDQVAPGIYYQYLMIAVDDAGLESKPSNIVIVKQVSIGDVPVPQTLKISKNMTRNEVSISWSCNRQDARHFEIYRLADDGQLRYYATVEAQSRIFVDKNVARNTSYTYRLRVQTSSGAYSPFSEAVSIDY